MANYEAWQGKDLSDIFRDIYKNQKQTQSQIHILIDSLRPLIKTAGDAAVIVPLIRDYLDVSVKNDSHIVRLASIVQRLYATDKLSDSSGAAGILTEDEKNRLLRQAEEELKEIRGNQDKISPQLESAKKAVAELTRGGEQEEKINDEEKDTE